MGKPNGISEATKRVDEALADPELLSKGARAIGLIEEAALENVNRLPKPPTISPYAPAGADPVRLATLTIESVGKIGEAAAKEVDKVADELEKGATAIATKIRELAEAMRSHTSEAHKHVEAFCAKSTTVLEGIRALADNLPKAH